ncbi:hypothetical protein DNTS_031788, partial [Danionella cerebrum]
INATFTMRTHTFSFLLMVSCCASVWAGDGRIRQKRSWIIESFTLEEDHPGPFPYRLDRVHAHKTDKLVRYELYGEGVDEDPKNILSIDNNRDIYVHGKVFYSKNKVLKIKILDINNHAPKFQKPIYEVTVNESHPQGKAVVAVLATDDDDSSTNNGTFSFTIKSVIPTPENVEFYIKQQGQAGTVFFRGCLDYEKADKYIILVEAKDHGDKIQLSSTSTLIVNIIDNNNNLPVFTGQTGTRKVRERESGVEVLRFQVSDKDTRGSKAWRANYLIYGDAKKQFDIQTDPVTNEGILTVVKVVHGITLMCRSSLDGGRSPSVPGTAGSTWPLAMLHWAQQMLKLFALLRNLLLISSDGAMLFRHRIRWPFIARVSIKLPVHFGVGAFPESSADGKGCQKFKDDLGLAGMDYEKQTHQNLTISVQNEIPYFSCKVKKQVPDALWELEKIPQDIHTSVANLYETVPVTIYVEDVNDPPIFIPPVKHVMVKENIDPGTSLTTFTAKDLDRSYANTVRFFKGEDVGGWIKVDAMTGEVSTATIVDRESPFLTNDTYKATIHAVDNDMSPLTATATLFIHVNDENDNAPVLVENSVNMCLDKEPTTANITAVDLDLDPYGSPFYYELLGDVKDKWKIVPAQGVTVTLVKEKMVHSGHHLLRIKISDQQGVFHIQNLSVSVCDCTLSATCHLRMVLTTQMGPTASLIMTLAVLLLIAMCFLTLMMTCREEKKMITTDEDFGCLVATNTEIPGTDCMKCLSLDELGVDTPHCYTEEGNPMPNAELDAISIPDNEFHPDLLGDLDSRFSMLAAVSRPYLTGR